MNENVSVFFVFLYTYYFNTIFSAMLSLRIQLLTRLNNFEHLLSPFLPQSAEKKRSYKELKAKNLFGFPNDSDGSHRAYTLQALPNRYLV